MKVRVVEHGKILDYDFIKEVYDDSDTWTEINGYIFFTLNLEKRAIYYSYSNCNSYENLQYYSEIGLEDMIKSETTFLSLNCDEKIDIMNDIVTNFGGYIDRNDCDDIPYEPVIKNPDKTIKPVYHVSMQDIYDKFGGIVIIDKE
jgi:hypothetical protein